MEKLSNNLAVQESPDCPIPQEVYGWRIYAITLSAALGPAMAGYDNAYIGGSLALDSFQKAFGIDDNNREALSSQIVSTVIAGGFVGTLLSYFVAEKWGRKRALMVAGALGLAGGVLQLFPHYIALLFVGRAIAGVGIGAQSGITSVFLSELAPPNIRGRMVGIKDVIGMLAQVVGYWINYGVNLHLRPSSMQWRIPVGLQLVVPGLLLLTMPFMVESPRWLAATGCDERALRNLSWVRDLPIDHAYIQKEFGDIKSEIAARKESVGDKKASSKTLFKELMANGMRGRFIMAASARCMTMFTGITALALYSPLIFEDLGFKQHSLLLTGIYGIVKVVSSLLILLFCMDNFGRRPAVLSGSIVIVLCQFYLGACSQISGSFEGSVAKDAAAYVALTAIYIFTAAFAWSWALYPCIFAGEVFPTHLRAFAVTISIIVGIIIHFVITYSIPYMLKDIEYGTFYVFGACTSVVTLIVYAFFPETKAFPLEKMELIFNGSPWARKARRNGERLLMEKQQPERATSSWSGESVGTVQIVV